MSNADAAMLKEIRDHLLVLRNEAVETRRILKMLVSVISDTERTNQAVREELFLMRTARERGDRVATLADRVNHPTEPPP